MHEHDEYEEARRMLAPLAGEPVGPSAVDVRRAMADGRRRLRTRRVAGAGAVVAVTALVVAGVPAALDAAGGPADPAGPAVPAVPAATGATPPATTAPAPPALPAPTACEAAPLSVPDGATESEVTGGDPTGRYLVGRAYDRRTGQEWALRWDDGEPAVLDIPVPSIGNLVVNSAGTVAGDGSDAQRGITWVYQDGQFAELPGSGDFLVTGINTAGDILGSDDILESGGDDGDGDPQWPDQHPPVVWPAGDRDAVRELAVPDGVDSTSAVAIGDDGTVVGYSRHPYPPPLEDFEPSDITTRSLVWAPDGTRSELPVPEGFGADSSALDLRGGWVVGTVHAPSQDWPDATFARWYLPTGEVLPGSGLAYVSAVNSHGWLAGHSREPDGIEHPALDVDGEVFELPEPPEAVATPEGTTAVTVSDDGRVVGGFVQVTGSATDIGDLAAVRWTCH